ncbi:MULTISPECIES: VOC family protein [unclassified Bacillus (in: firmicutes)]|uniref:VOC family protein n=1 Tax=unclassified Bacillus (in: firmicutes) TaxID=185979 RepID=UPI0008E1EA69|nr:MULTISPECIES: VOC family protein [unclassified Bacillus (in: firmicutes)]SFB17463.1 Catechol 2,3-dioxygenase [Bacillus sp. UNCCL13]SFQ77051.1 Catechol 2,3-dioxygenase [Bacillus sp. cl95]
MSQVCVIGIYVPNIQKAIDFYTTVLGFEVNKQYGPKIVTLVHGELPIVLEESENALNNLDITTRGVVLGLKTEDIHQTVKLLKEHNVDFIVGEPEVCPPGKFISFRDPFGNILEYLQFD